MMGWFSAFRRLANSVVAYYPKPKPRLLCLPDEVLLCIIRALEVRDIVAFQRTCRFIHNLALDRSLWAVKYTELADCDDIRTLQRPLVECTVTELKKMAVISARIDRLWSGKRSIISTRKLEYPKDRPITAVNAWQLVCGGRFLVCQDVVGFYYWDLNTDDSLPRLLSDFDDKPSHRCFSFHCTYDDNSGLLTVRIASTPIKAPFSETRFAIWTFLPDGNFRLKHSTILCLDSYCVSIFWQEDTVTCSPQYDASEDNPTVYVIDLTESGVTSLCMSALRLLAPSFRTRHDKTCRVQGCFVAPSRDKLLVLEYTHVSFFTLPPFELTKSQRHAEILSPLWTYSWDPVVSEFMPIALIQGCPNLSFLSSFRVWNVDKIRTFTASTTALDQFDVQTYDLFDNKAACYGRSSFQGRRGLHAPRDLNTTSNHRSILALTLPRLHLSSPNAESIPKVVTTGFTVELDGPEQAGPISPCFDQISGRIVCMRHEDSATRWMPYVAHY